jgi:hypothetical protein
MLRSETSSALAECWSGFAHWAPRLGRPDVRSLEGRPGSNLIVPSRMAFPAPNLARRVNRVAGRISVLPTDTPRRRRLVRPSIRERRWPGGFCPENGPLARFPFPSWFVSKAMPYRSGSSGSSSRRGRSSGGSSTGRLSGPGGSTGWFGVLGWGSPGMLGCIGGLGPPMSSLVAGVMRGKR